MNRRESFIRLTILGNSGAGKTTLARQLSLRLGVPFVSLDSIFWMPGGFERKRPAREIDADLVHLLSLDEWTVEGVFGELAGRLMDRTTHLIFLDLPWRICRKGLLEREAERRRLAPPLATRTFRGLLRWASNYEKRLDSRSRTFHAGLHDKFPGPKLHLKQRMDSEEIHEWLLGHLHPSA